MPILITADLHLSDSNRDTYRHTFMKDLPARLKMRGIDLLLVLGDLTEQKDQHAAWLTNAVAEYFYNCAKVCPVVITRGNHDCVSSDTELLTQRGWISYTDIRPKDLVLGMDLQTKRGVWQQINSVVVKTVDELWENNGRGLSILCSKNHRVMTERLGKFHFSTPNNVLKSHRVATSVQVENKEIDLTDEEIELSAWILTDGSVPKHGLMIYQSKEPYVQRIDCLLKSMGLGFRKKQRLKENEAVGTSISGVKIKSNRPSYEWSICATDSIRLKDKLSLKEGKPLPDWTYQLSKRQFEVFARTLVNANGTWYKPKTWLCVLYGQEKALSEFQPLFHMHNLRATLTWSNVGQPVMNISSRVLTGEGSLIFHEHKLEHPQTVWCINVPLQNFMVRRKGKVHLTGNCLDVTTPFFGFLSRIEGVTWVNVPTDAKRLPAPLPTALGRSLLLPHTPNYKRDWADLRFSGYDWIFAHNTFQGALGDHGQVLDGIPVSVFPEGVRVISGDIHSPQKLPPVTYVGSPTLIDFGDNFEPRVLIIEDGKKLISVKIPGPQKRLVHVSKIEALKKVSHCNEGDILKVRVDLDLSQHAQWPEMRKQVAQWGEDHGYIIHTIQPVLDRSSSMITKDRGRPQKSDLDLLKDYSKARGIDDLTHKAALKLIETTQ